jgi:hypothetical protein
MKAFARILYVLSLTAFCAACGGGGGGSASSPTPTQVVNASPGGIWEGIDSDGVDVIALVTETGRFHFINELFDSGSGILSVSNGNEVSGNFQLVTELGSVFSDGTTLANCTLSGTVVERQTINGTINCTTTAGRQSQSTITLNYNPLYERDSSLSVIAGNYDDSGLVINIDANGVIFEQVPVSGCVNNGQVSILNPAFNAYDVQFGFSNCTGQFAILNGTSFVGIATLDNTVTPEALIVGATGEIAGVLVSFVGISERLAPPPPPPQPPCNLSTSFEFNATGPFCIGTSPFTATFSSGVTKSVGQSDLYSSGDFSWHVLSGTSATVTFETLPSTVTFFVRTEFMGTVSDIQILDENGDLITPVTPTNVFQQIVVNRDPGQTIIGSIVVTSTSGGDVVIDDFIFVIN